MSNDSPLKALLVTVGVALVCSILVSATTVALKPLQSVYKNLERNRLIVAAAGLVTDSSVISDRDVAELFSELEAHVVDLDSGQVAEDINPLTFDQRKAAATPELSVAIPDKENVAALGRRSKYAVVYFVKKGDNIERVVLPIHGQGMWSTIYGYLAINADLNTIAEIKFYEQGETPGVGDRILDPVWQAGWRNKTIFDDSGAVRLRVAAGPVDPNDPDARYQVDGLSGATITADAVANMVRYWLGDHGFGPFLSNLQ